MLIYTSHHEWGSPKLSTDLDERIKGSLSRFTEGAGWDVDLLIVP